MLRIKHERHSLQDVTLMLYYIFKKFFVEIASFVP